MRSQFNVIRDEPDPGELLSTEVLAQLLGVKIQWLTLARRKQNGPPFLRLGTQIRYRRRDVDTWLEQCAVEGARK